MTHGPGTGSNPPGALPNFLPLFAPCCVLLWGAGRCVVGAGGSVPFFSRASINGWLALAVTFAAAGSAGDDATHVLLHAQAADATLAVHPRQAADAGARRPRLPSGHARGDEFAHVGRGPWWQERRRAQQPMATIPRPRCARGSGAHEALRCACTQQCACLGVDTHQRHSCPRVPPGPSYVRAGRAAPPIVALLPIPTVCVNLRKDAGEWQNGLGALWGVHRSSVGATQTRGGEPSAK
jgi:hypothetical protein